MGIKEIVGTIAGAITLLLTIIIAIRKNNERIAEEKRRLADEAAYKLKNAQSKSDKLDAWSDIDNISG